MTENLVLTFLGGKRLQNTIAATAGNVVTSLSPDTGKRWLILRCRITLVCDANAANRYFVVQITDGTNITETIATTILNKVIATQTAHFCMGEARNAKDATLGDDGDDVQSYVGIDPILIEGADQLRITVAAGLAGDSYSGFVIVREL